MSIFKDFFCYLFCHFEETHVLDITSDKLGYEQLCQLDIKCRHGQIECQTTQGTKEEKLFKNSTDILSSFHCCHENAEQMEILWMQMDWKNQVKSFLTR